MNLFPFQELGRDHLAGQRVALLADDMGLGKSITAVRATEVEPADRVTVVCPAVMVDEWLSGESGFRLAGDVPRSVAVLGRKGPDPATADVVLSSYDRAAKPEAAAMLAARGGHVIFDEAHALKEPESKRTLTLLGYNGPADNAAKVSFLTGTPAPNHAGELFGMLAAAGRYRGDYAAFLGEYCHTRSTPYGEKVTGYKNAAGLRALQGGKNQPCCRAP